ncbi:MAG: SLBB domain-containing protein [Candidatus Poribacteria bacterium]
MLSRLNLQLRLFLVALLSVSGVAIAAAEYRIQPGDMLRIVVLNRPDYGQEVVVQDDGEIIYFILGSMHVESLTLDELRQRLTDGLRPHLTAAEVLVVRTPQANDVYVGGQVANPGKYQFKQARIDLRKALAQAGDALTLSADASRVYLLRDGAVVATVDLTDPRGPHTEVLRGDVVYVPELTRIRVTGNVRAPGVFHVRGGVSAGYALALAGGIVDDQGTIGRLEMLRADGTTLVIALDSPAAEDAPDLPQLAHGDTLHVPNAYVVEEVSVLGYVQNPGLYRVRGPVSVGRALALAGDVVRDEAKLDEVELLRLDGSVETIDVRTGATATLVQPGETVRVNRRFQISWPLVFSAVSSAVLLTSLLRN